MKDTRRFDNRFVRELPGDPCPDNRPRPVHGACYSRVRPTAVVAPRLLAFSADMAAQLGFPADEVASPHFAQVFGGNALLDGMESYASCYGGHQFGHWAGQLGDGRAIGLGELVDAAGRRWELQLKGAGPTPYSRGADGRAVLRSSVREFLCSEAMCHLGVPTTRALSLVTTGEPVVRDLFYDGRPRAEPGAVVCRVAPSFLRFGHFELPAARADLALLTRLVDFAIDRDFPHLVGAPASKRGDWFGEVCARTAALMAHWMRVGFVHGVMNTDNMSILGLTLDYGPYGWMDHFDAGWTPNTTDAEGRRYRFGHQPRVAHWNLLQLAHALAPVFEDAAVLEAGLQRYVDEYERLSRQMHAAKLGLAGLDRDDQALIDGLYRLLAAGELDMTLFFRELAGLDLAQPTPAFAAPAVYDPARFARIQPELGDWLQAYALRAGRDGLPAPVRRERMNAVNPRFVLRNYLAQEAIEAAEAGDGALIETLLDTLRRPYAEQPGRERFAARRPDWAKTRVGCAMLSCSS